jgi:hypothetical protein
MKEKSTQKRRTKLTHLTWLGVLMAAAFLFATCFEFTTLNQPTQGYINTSFDVPIVLKPGEGHNFAAQLDDLGCFGILLPEGWTVEEDSFFYRVRGTFNDEPVGPIHDTGYVVYDETYAIMYEDSVGSDEGYYWWGGLTNDTVNVDNLDSMTLTITITPGDSAGDFELQYAVGTLDWEYSYPIARRKDNDVWAISDKMPITIIDNTSVKEYLKGQISIYPNPVAELLTVDVGDVRKGSIELIDMTGRLHFSKKFKSEVNTIDVSDYPAGTYILRVDTKKGDYSQKVMIR